MSEPPKDDASLWRQEIISLPDEEILALCYGLHSRPPQGRLPRLRLYCDVLSRRATRKAQLASSLICFDMARQGDAIAQAQFKQLSEQLRQLLTQDEKLAEVMQQDPYLSMVWEMCHTALTSEEFASTTTSYGNRDGNANDNRDGNVNDNRDGNVANDVSGNVEDLTPSVHANPKSFTPELQSAVNHFLGVIDGTPAHMPDAGFRLKNAGDVERLERFLQVLESVGGVVPLARGWQALVLLFYGTQLRARSLFGGFNQQRLALLREGAAQWWINGGAFYTVVGVLNEMHAEPEVWPRIQDVLAQYVQYLQQLPAQPDSSWRDIESMRQLSVKFTPRARL